MSLIAPTTLRTLASVAGFAGVRCCRSCYGTRPGNSTFHLTGVHAIQLASLEGHVLGLCETPLARGCFCDFRVPLSYEISRL